MQESKTTEPKPEFPYQKQSCTGDQRAYSVEARFVGKGVGSIAGQTFTAEWQKINFEQHPMGVPTAHRYEFAAPYFGLMTYQAAQALRWWFHAIAEHERLDMCYETRIVEHRVKYSLEEEAIAAYNVMGCSDALSKQQRTASPFKGE